MSKVFHFPYKKYFNDAYPIIKIYLKSRFKIIETEAYVDSGASTSIFMPEVASLLGINYTKGKRCLTMVGDGDSIPMYIHKVPIRIGDVWIKTTVGFSDRLGASINLLGQKDIFDRFDVTFSKHKGRVSFSPI